MILPTMSSILILLQKPRGDNRRQQISDTLTRHVTATEKQKQRKILSINDQNGNSATNSTQSKTTSNGIRQTPKPRQQDDRNQRTIPILRKEVITTADISNNKSPRRQSPCLNNQYNEQALHNQAKHDGSKLQSVDSRTSEQHATTTA